MRMCKITLEDGEIREMTMNEFNQLPFDGMFEVFNKKRIIKTDFFEEDGT